MQGVFKGFTKSTNTGNPFESNKFLSWIFVFTGFLSVVFWGLFSPQYLIVFTCIFALLVLFCKKITFKPALFPVFILIAVISLSYAFGSGSFLPIICEICKWLVLILSCIIFCSEYGIPLSLGFYFGITFSALVGLAAYSGIIPSELFGKLQLAGTVDGSKELFSFFGYSNTAAVFFGSAVFMGLSFYEKKVLPNSFTVLVAINVLALYMTKSSFAFIFFISASILLVATKRNRLKHTLTILAGLTLIFLTILLVFRINPGSTVISRIIYALDSFKAFKPLGIGFGNWAELKYTVQSAIYSTDYLHNGYLQLFIEGGIQAFIPFGVFIFLLIKSVIKEKTPFNIAITFYILLHAFVDIDMAYGCYYILLAYCTANGSKSINPRSFFKPVLHILLIVVILISTLAFKDLYSPLSAEHYDSAIKNGTVTVREVSTLYKGSENIKDSKSMLFFSELWLHKAPKSQEAYNARFQAIETARKSGFLDEAKYLVFRSALYDKAKQENSTMNKLCHYLVKNKSIELP